MTTVFKSEIKNEELLYDPIDFSQSLRRVAVKGTLEYSPPRLHSRKFYPLDNSYHPFINLLGIAFSKHVNVVLTPDLIWILIIQGFGEINKTEKILKKSGSFKLPPDVKEELVVSRNDFIQGEQNPWNEVIDSFLEKMGEFMVDDKLKSCIEPKFSTTTAVHKLVSTIIFFDMASEFFDFTLSTMCGIPKVIVEGNKEDYEIIIEKCRTLRELFPSISWWIDCVIPVVTEFVEFKKNPDTPNEKFWINIFKKYGVSGKDCDVITGWCLVFFPYTKNGKNPYLKSWGYCNPQAWDYNGIDECDFPASSISIVPFTWKYYEEKIIMAMVGGSVGIEVLESHEASPNEQTLRIVYDYVIMKEGVLRQPCFNKEKEIVFRHYMKYKKIFETEETYIGYEYDLDSLQLVEKEKTVPKNEPQSMIEKELRDLAWRSAEKELRTLRERGARERQKIKKRRSKEKEGKKVKKNPKKKFNFKEFFAKIIGK